MKRFIRLAVVIFALPVFLAAEGDCDGPPSSDAVQRSRQEIILKEGIAQVGIPSVKNFREMKIVKDIIELRDQEGLVTYMYLENVVPKVVPGHTSLGGKLTFVGQTIGYGISAATQFTNPQKIEQWGSQSGYAILPQADPNGLFSPSSAEGSWVMMYDEKAQKALPQYSEPRMLVFTFKFPLDTVADLRQSLGQEDLTAEQQ